MKMNILLIIIFFFTTLGCKKSDKVQINSSLIGEWTLTSIQDVKTNQIINYPDSITVKESITFTDSDSTLLFGGLCNSGNGKYSINSNKLTFPVGIFITKTSCKNDGWEDYLHFNLLTASVYNINSNQLIIKSNGTFNLIFQKKTP